MNVQSGLCRYWRWPGLAIALCLVAGCDDEGGTGTTLDGDVRARIAQAGLTGDPSTGRDIPDINDPLPQLGKLLFFTKGLGGDEDSACVSCHHPELGAGDALALPIGVGAEDPDRLGPGRVHAATAPHWDGGPTVPRNAPTTFNVVCLDEVQFHDGRVESLDKIAGANGAFDPATGEGIRTPDSPFGEPDPDAGGNLIWAQARFPITSPEEMRGFDFAAGEDNDTLRARLEARFRTDPDYSGWLPLFREAYGDPDATAAEVLTEQHIAQALGAYQRSQAFIDNPWKAYVEGDDHAISTAAKRGALLFLTPITEGGAGCVRCHEGDTFTDEGFHVLAVPQIGRGKGDGPTGDGDLGRFRESSEPQDRYAFRTPMLLNVAVTGPYGHSGAYASLKGMVRHHLDAEAAVEDYLLHLDERLAVLEYNGYTIQANHTPANTQAALAQLRANREAGVDDVLRNVPMSDREVQDILAFLRTLTDPRVEDPQALAPWIPSAEDPNPDGLRLEARLP